MKKENNNAVHALLGKGKRGFTLLELLVVVIIIGILAAVALPQYQLSVLKTRTATLVPLLKSVVQAEHLYYLGNGAYTRNFNELDIEMPAGTIAKSPDLVVYNHFTCEFSGNTASAIRCRDTLSDGPRVEHYFESDFFFCWATTTMQHKVCQSLGGKEKSSPYRIY